MMADRHMKHENLRLVEQMPQMVRLNPMRQERSGRAAEPPPTLRGTNLHDKILKKRAVECLMPATVKSAASGRNGLHRVNKTALTLREMDHYFRAHPGSPSAVRRPHLYLEGATFVALLGPNVKEGIVGLGMTIEAAFRAFDLQYSRLVRSPDD
jgi:hypothetical protein